MVQKLITLFDTVFVFSGIYTKIINLLIRNQKVIRSKCLVL